VESARDTPPWYPDAKTPLGSTTAERTWYAKTVHNAYRQPLDRPAYMQHDTDLYSDTNFMNTPKSLSPDEASINDRRVIYEQVSIQSSDTTAIYAPIDRDVTNAHPIYVAIRGTDNIWDIFKDVNLLLNYETGQHLDLTGYNTTVTSIYNDVVQTLNAYPNFQVEFASHSLGCQIAFDVFRRLWNNGYQSRLSKNVFFNPFIIIMDDYNLDLEASNDYREKYHAYIIDADFASIVYKNNPLSQDNLEIFENAVEQADGWISTISDLTRTQYLNVENHSLSTFTGGSVAYPDQVYPAYIPGTSARQVNSLNRYSLKTYDEALTNEPMMLERDASPATSEEWLVGSIEVDSGVGHYEEYNITFTIANTTDMIFRNNQWSFPLYAKVSDQAYDYSRYFYFFRAYDEQDDQSYYMAQMQNDTLEYYSLRTVQFGDYSRALRTQYNDGEPAYHLFTETEFQSLQALGQSSPNHQKLRWFISDVRARSHTGERRVLEELPFNGLTQLKLWSDATTQMVISPAHLLDRFVMLDKWAVNNDQTAYAVVKQSQTAQDDFHSKIWYINDTHTAADANKFRLHNHPMVNETDTEPADLSRWRLGHQNIAGRLRNIETDPDTGAVTVNSTTYARLNWTADLVFVDMGNDTYRIQHTITAEDYDIDGNDISSFIGQTITLYWTDFGNAAYPDEIPPFVDEYGTTDIVMWDTHSVYLTWGGNDNSLFKIRPYDAVTDNQGP
jgi:hypothetical protein